MRSRLRAATLVFRAVLLVAFMAVLGLGLLFPVFAQMDEEPKELAVSASNGSTVEGADRDRSARARVATRRERGPK